MKSLLASVAVIALLSACGGEEPTTSKTYAAKANANQFSCQDGNTLQVNYSSSSLNGQPLMTVSQAVDSQPVALVAAKGSQIKLALSGTDTVVTTTTMIPDRQTTTWELALPAAVTQSSQTQTFSTVLTQVVKPTSIAGTETGQTTTVTSHPVTCTARRAVF